MSQVSIFWLIWISTVIFFGFIIAHMAKITEDLAEQLSALRNQDNRADRLKIAHDAQLDRARKAEAALAELQNHTKQLERVVAENNQSLVQRYLEKGMVVYEKGDLIARVYLN